MSDFSDTPLVVGTVVGIRAFHIDNLGRLHSPSYKSGPFLPGENVATCLKRRSSYATFAPTRRLAVPSSWGFTVSSTYFEWEADYKVDDEPEPPHKAGNIECTCGWYAYYDGSNEYKGADNIGAVVEGYGVCTVGERGFRAEKARLVALFKPGRHVNASRVARALHNYDVPLYASKREAIGEHPMTMPLVPTPESHADFWDLP